MNAPAPVLGFVKAAPVSGSVPADRRPGVGGALSRLSRVETWLYSQYISAVREARALVPVDGLAQLIQAAQASGFLKADDLPAISWDLTAPLGNRILGEPYQVIEVSIARFDALWERDGQFYVAAADSALTDGIARLAAQGLFLPPPAVAWSGGWGFLDGRNRYLYMRDAGFKTMPLAVPQGDAAMLHDAAGTASPAVRAVLPLPAEAPARSYADLFDAIDHIAHVFSNRFYSAEMMAAIAIGEAEETRVARVMDVRNRVAARAAKLDKLETSFDFETPNFGAVAELRESILGLVRESTAEQRKVILEVLQSGVQRGINPIEMARELRGTIGLTSAQQRYVDNYRRALERVHVDVQAKANALGRELADGRYNSTINRAGVTGKALSPEQIEAMTANYRDRWIAHRAEVIARTEALAATGMSERAVWEAAVANGDIRREEVIETWNTAHDGRVRSTHRGMDLQQHPMGEPFTSGGGVTLRYPGDPEAPARERIHCFPAGTCVAGNVKTAMRHWYEGELIEIATSAGHKLSGTPNHPVLTQRGWVGLGALDESDYVFSGRISERMSGDDPDVNYADAAIEQIFDALAVSGVAVRAPFHAVDFHGYRPDHDVDVVRADRILGDGLKAVCSKPVHYGIFAAPDLGERFRLGDCRAVLVNTGFSCAAHRGVRRLAEAFSLFLGRFRHALEHGLASIAGIQPGILQMDAYGAALNIEMGGNRFDGFAGSEHFDDGIVPFGSAVPAPHCLRLAERPANSSFVGVAQNRSAADAQSVRDCLGTHAVAIKRNGIRNIRRFGFVGHIYTLETADGFYLANGLFVHNCRCIITRQLTEKPVEPVVGQPGSVGSTGIVDAEADALAANEGMSFDRIFSGGTKPKEIWRTADGEEFLFKPVVVGEEYIAEAEIFGSKVSRIVSADAPEVLGITLDGRYGSLQKLLKTATPGDLADAVVSRMALTEIKAIEREHPVDWLISNHDAHQQQFIRLAGKGNKVVPIDKGQALKYFGQDKLGITYHPNAVYGEREPIYNRLWREYAENPKFAAKVSLDPVYDSIRKLQAIPDSEFIQILRPYAESRFRGNQDKIDFFVDLVLQRKHSLETDFRRFFIELEKIDIDNTVFGNWITPRLRQDVRETLQELELQDKLTEDQFIAIRQYTGSISGAINQPLRTLPEVFVENGRANKTNIKVWERAARSARVIDEGLDALPAYQGVVHRGVDLYRSLYLNSPEFAAIQPRTAAEAKQILANAVQQKYQVGKAITFPDMTSTSAGRIFFSGLDTEFIIVSKTGRDISRLSHSDFEKEVLFKSNTRFIVTKVEMGQQIKIWLEEANEIDFAKI